MELYRIHNNENMSDSHGTCKFIERISALIHAFSSRTPKGALNMNCSERNVRFPCFIISILNFLVLKFNNLNSVFILYIGYTRILGISR